MSWYRIKRSIREWWHGRRLLRYVQPTYDPKYGVPLKTRLLQSVLVGLVVAMVIGLVIYAMSLPKQSNESNDNGAKSNGSSSQADDNSSSPNNVTDANSSNTDATNTANDSSAQPVAPSNTATATTAPANHTNPDYQKLPACNVTRVSDGDTFYVDCLSQRIRLVGVDTPESTNKHQCYGIEASNHTKSLLGQRVYLETDPASGDLDTYGRPLRFVYLADGTNYNMQLIEDGYGMLYIFRDQQFSYRDKFAAAQEAAKSAGRGLWSACQTGINKYGNYRVTN